MEILSQVDGINILARFISERNIIPVFGAGFTMKSSAYKGSVPDGSVATSMMKKMLVDHCTKMNEDDVKDMDFNETSELFIDLVPKDIRTDFFKNYFTEVQLGMLEPA